jgi:hypothetical protein
VINFALKLLFSLRKVFGIYWIRVWIGPRTVPSVVVVVGKKQYLLLSGTEPELFSL